jgi:hypothetical protein
MFGIIKEKDRIRKAESENNALKVKNQLLEDALLELAQIVSEAQNGEVVRTEDN